MSDHPYQHLPDHCFWRRSIADVVHSEVDPVVRAKFKVSREHRIVTAGSCFAQHIARHLMKNGFNYFVTEPAHPLVSHLASDYNYGIFTARYGNIYTSRQLLQTLQRAYGLFVPKDFAWPGKDGRVFDPYRPQIQPGGFASLDELTEDRRQHFAAIRRAIEELDVFVFTLGLTEAWFNRVDDAVYPLCPGVAGGTFDGTKHGFVNFGVLDVVSDLKGAIELVLARNPQARFILTVSPVPLIATAEDRSVLVSTAYSKSVLRVAAEEIAAGYHQVAYFPSYEIITGNFSRGMYFADGLRDVSEEGVSHVMRLFMKHYAMVAEDMPALEVPASDHRQETAQQIRRELEEVVAVMCDEVSLDADVHQHVKVPDLSLVREAESVPVTACASVVPSAPQSPSAMEFLKGAVHASPERASTLPVESHRIASQRHRGIFTWFRRT